MAFSHLIIIDFIVNGWESGTWIALMLRISMRPIIIKKHEHLVSAEVLLQSQVSKQLCLESVIAVAVLGGLCNAGLSSPVCSQG